MKKLSDKQENINLTEKQKAFQVAFNKRKFIKTVYFEKSNVEVKIILN